MSCGSTHMSNYGLLSSFSSKNILQLNIMNNNIMLQRVCTYYSLDLVIEHTMGFAVMTFHYHTRNVLNSNAQIIV